VGLPRFAVVDLETSGLSSRRHRILQIGLVTVEPDGAVVDQWSTLVRLTWPWSRVGPRRLHGITRRDLRDAPSTRHALDELARRLDGGVFTAHNADFDADFLEGQGDMNRVQFVNSLASDWMPALPDVHERLQAGGRIADVACGTGWSTIALARAYPNADVDGLDLDEASIGLAKENAAQEGMDISFEVRDAADPGLSGRYDLVTCFEAVHDMSRPVESLRGMRSLLAEDGILLIADENVAEQFTAPGDEVERLMYGFSLFHCLAVGLEEQPSAATGTAMRPDTLRGYAEEAGFTRFEILPIENDFWRFYRLEG
jgi:2-polyprenyl-3-methyl-5-hydroxy-6-metoxy-1,4-benzoquinol methylase